MVLFVGEIKKGGDKMFCFQCEETMNGSGCTKVGMCGKVEGTAILQDNLIYLTKIIAKKGKF